MNVNNSIRVFIREGKILLKQLVFAWAGILLVILLAFVFISFFGCVAKPQILPTKTVLTPPPPPSHAINDMLQTFSVPVSDTDYPLGPGDTLEIKYILPMFGSTNGEQQIVVFDVTVASDGTVYIPEVSTHLNVKGKTISEMNELVKYALRNYYRHPNIRISLKEKVSQRITVTGSVAKPGIQYIVPGTTVFQVLAWAGGLNPLTAGTKVQIIRRIEEEQMTLPVNLLPLQDGNFDADELAIIVKPGDIVFVPDAKTISVLGEVNNAKSITLTRAYTVSESIALAGGLKDYADPENVKVIQDNGTVLDERAISNHVVRAGDVVYVMARNAKGLDEFINRFTKGLAIVAGGFLFGR
jgi:polysaccharide biosynthesis/export protein